MAYSVMARRLLISCPGDIPVTDLSLVQKAINRWNGNYGEKFGAAIIPISWGTNAAAEFGDAPQELLNKQLVDRCDMCLALFADRLGTPTASAESGTAEEISRLSESGRYVGVLRSRRAATGINPDQLKSLEQYLERIKTKALILDYYGDADLIQNVDNFLLAAVSRDQGRTDVELQEVAAHGPAVRQAEVWPHIDRRDSTRSLGDRIFPLRSWYLILNNTGDSPARDVRVSWRTADGNDIPWAAFGVESDEEPHIEIFAPHSETSYPIYVTRDTPRQANCIVSWNDQGGGRLENMATLRLV